MNSYALSENHFLHEEERKETNGGSFVVKTDANPSTTETPSTANNDTFTQQEHELDNPLYDVEVPETQFYDTPDFPTANSSNGIKSNTTTLGNSENRDYINPLYSEGNQLSDDTPSKPYDSIDDAPLQPPQQPFDVYSYADHEEGRAVTSKLPHAMYESVDTFAPDQGSTTARHHEASAKSSKPSAMYDYADPFVPVRVITATEGGMESSEPPGVYDYADPSRTVRVTATEHHNTTAGSLDRENATTIDEADNIADPSEHYEFSSVH